jgi:hypothetical protein
MNRKREHAPLYMIGEQTPIEAENNPKQKN